MMEYKGYVGRVEFDPDKRILHGEVAGIRDVVTFQATSVKELERQFKASVDDYLAFCKDRGEEPDKPYSGQFVMRIDADLHRRASTRAQATGTSLNAFVTAALLKEIEGNSSPVAKGRRKTGKRPVRRRKIQSPIGH